MGEEREQRLELGYIPPRTAGDGAEAGQSYTRKRERGRRIREARQDRRSGILHTDAGACIHGAAGGAGGLSRRESTSLGADAESARSTRGDCDSLRSQEARCDSVCDAARGRLREKIISRFCRRSGRALEEDGKASEGRVEPRG